jgi:hypothetical protein
MAKSGGFTLLAGFTTANRGHSNISPVLTCATAFGSTAAGSATVMAGGQEVGL